MRPLHSPRGGARGGPRLPEGLLRDFFRIRADKVFRQDKGGVYETVVREESKLRGTLFPLDNEDIRYLPEGTGTVDTQKLYTNGDVLELGQQVRDSLDEKIYTVVAELTHGPVHELKRYIVTKGGATKNG